MIFSYLMGWYWICRFRSDNVMRFVTISFNSSFRARALSEWILPRDTRDVRDTWRSDWVNVVGQTEWQTITATDNERRHHALRYVSHCYLWHLFDYLIIHICNFLIKRLFFKFIFICLFARKSFGTCRTHIVMWSCKWRMSDTTEEDKMTGEFPHLFQYGCL